MISILAQERLLGAALGFAFVGTIVFEQRRGIYGSIADDKSVQIEKYEAESTCAHLWSVLLQSGWKVLLQRAERVVGSRMAGPMVDRDKWKGLPEKMVEGSLGRREQSAQGRMQKGRVYGLGLQAYAYERQSSGASSYSANNQESLYNQQMANLTAELKHVCDGISAANYDMENFHGNCSGNPKQIIPWNNFSSELAFVWNKAIDGTLGQLVAYLSSRRW
ncbi:hypothetical protein IEQ34_007497 [Dendrobium chrysotoxum]|uniref:Uncharacterized protein n=1 Tax=Dendrobium chrysotoxum TaxID=161865 RepID=A0AAV7GLY4_DENCH|nr:hypothetical protein IEQ34_007497 [Dendrobium chrysotoxum]